MTSLQIQASKINTILRVLCGCLLAWVMGGQFNLAEAFSVPDQAIETKVIHHVKQAVETHFGRKLAADELTIHVVKIPSVQRDFAQATTLGDIHFELNSSIDKFYSNRGVVRVTMTDSTGVHHQVGVPVTLSVTRPVWVVDKPIPAGKTLSRSDFRMMKKEISQMALTTVRADQDLAAFEARINLQPGEILDIRKIHAQPAIRRFSDIRVLMTRGEGFAITAQGTALSDGQIGEIIRIRIRPGNDVSRTKYYTAKVINKNQVQVDL
jgi:flagella basal body P-ring formation protein FlgA